MEIVKFYANERAGLPDFKAATGSLTLGDQLRETRGIILPDGRTTGQALAGGRILSGFGFSGNPVAAQQATIIRGNAVVPFWDEETGQVTFGLLLSGEGDTSKILDFSTSGAGSWAVYIRFTYASSTFENRVFWDADGAPAAEYIDNVATRRSAQWEAVFQDAAAAPPGVGEYVKIWVITTDATAGGTITAITDFRHFFFEGSPHASDGPYEPEWGDGSNDRVDDRTLDPVGDFHDWVQAVRRQLADIIGDASGDHRWQKIPAIELLSLNVEHWSESESGSGTPGWHKQVSIGPTGEVHRLSSIDQDTMELEISNNPDSPVVQINVDDGAGLSTIHMHPRGAGSLLTNGDDARRDIGDGGGGNPDFRETLSKVALDSYNYRIQLHGDVAIDLDGGSAAAQQRVGFLGQVQAAEEFRITPTKLTQTLMVPLQLMSNLGAGGWGYDEVLPGGAGRLTINGTAALRYCSMEMVLPHNAIISYIQVLWAQDLAGTGVNAGVRLWAKKHRVAQNTVGIIGGGTGSPTSIVNIKTAAQYEEHLLSSGGAASPYRRVQRYTCDEATANRTFDQTQDKLVITLESVDDAARTESVYWIMVAYAIDYVSPPLT
jgi:hypothetical protein